ncbi:hypothetical protein MIMGU_mgv11b013506mg [Erythranthe guttata]|uniref:Uncharacterized protein n=1 Tax=Erythranthe guttata TaxID=4155 RepID=A0A022RVN9_ERYGU|nr:hypothetical protein MIMGU_mgv11b013506mg [Erythranthe guttata]
MRELVLNLHEKLNYYTNRTVNSYHRTTKRSNQTKNSQIRQRKKNYINSISTPKRALNSKKHHQQERKPHPQFAKLAIKRSLCGNHFDLSTQPKWGKIRNPDKGVFVFRVFDRLILIFLLPSPPIQSGKFRGD